MSHDQQNHWERLNIKYQMLTGKTKQQMRSNQVKTSIHVGDKAKKKLKKLQKYATYSYITGVTLRLQTRRLTPASLDEPLWL